MKLIKRFATAILSICLIVPCFSMMVCAADGSVQFTDPDAQQGKTVVVEGVVRGGESPIGDVSLTMAYDANALEFVSGDNVTGGAGTITYATKGNGTDVEIRFAMKFNVLTAGDLMIQATGGSATISSGEVLNLDMGAATVKAAEGDGTTAYETPAGNAQTEQKQPAETTEANAQTAEVTVQISDMASITLLDDSSAVTLPEQYKKTVLSVNDVSFPAWQDTEHQEYYILYAMNGDGDKALYQYNRDENTYQKFIKPEVVQTEDETTPTGILGGLQKMVDSHFAVILIVVIAIILILLILMIVFAVKLRRNRQDEDVYVEEKDLAGQPAADEYDEEENDEDDYEDDYEDDMYADYDDDEYQEDFLADQNLDDFDDIPPVRGAEVESDDEDYSVDFLDL